MSVQWIYLSRAWNLCEWGKIAGEALTALSMLRLADRREINLEIVQSKLKRVNELLNFLAEEIKSIGEIADRYDIRLSDISSPILKTFLDLYGIANSQDAIKRIAMLNEILKNILEGKYDEEEIDSLERFLRAILRTSTNEVEKLMRPSDTVWIL